MKTANDIKSTFDLDSDEVKELIENARAKESDFELGDYRFINTDDIDKIMQDELESDEYVLGCFSDWILADVLGIDIEAIQAMQEADAYTAIGKLVISMGKLEELQEAYVRADGYDHHFGRYGGNEEELFIAGELYHVFRIN